MTTFEWIPDPEEMVEIVAPLYPEIRRSEAADLLAYVTQVVADGQHGPSHVPIAFYSHLRTTLLDDSIWNMIEAKGARETIEAVRQGKYPVLRSLALPSLKEAARRLLGDGQLANHLGRGAHG